MTDQKFEVAQAKILRPHQPAYYAAHQELWPDWSSGKPAGEWQPLIFNYPHLTVIGSAHTHSIKDPMILQIKEHVKSFCGKKILDHSHKLLFVEGYGRGALRIFPSLDTAIEQGGESGMTIHLGRLHTIAVDSPEVASNSEASCLLLQTLKKNLGRNKMFYINFSNHFPGLFEEML